jgi:hypothetical protein
MAALSQAGRASMKKWFSSPLLPLLPEARLGAEQEEEKGGELVYTTGSAPPPSLPPPGGGAKTGRAQTGRAKTGRPPTGGGERAARVDTPRHGKPSVSSFPSPFGFSRTKKTRRSGFFLFMLRYFPVPCPCPIPVPRLVGSCPVGMLARSALICCAVGLVESNCRYLVHASRALSYCFRST